MPSWADGAERPRGVLVLLCNWEPYKAFQNLIRSGRALPPGFVPLTLPCSGRLDPALALAGLERGAEGIIVFGCREGACRHGPGPASAREEVERLEKLLDILGLGRERLRKVELGGEEADRLLAEARAFAGRLEELGSSPLARKEGSSRERSLG